MKNRHTTIILILTLLISSVSFSQTETNVSKLLEFASKRKAELAAMREEARTLANLKNMILRLENENGIIDLQYLKNNIPQYYQTNNLGAAQTTRADKLWAAPYNVDGTGYSQLGEWDGGGVLTTHQEFGSRVTQMDAASGTSEHSTHVAGTMIAAGVDANAKGMAFNANLKAWEWTDDEVEMATAAANGLEISNHSYGFIRGWHSDFGPKGPGNYWYGDKDISTQEDIWFGFYDAETQSIDQIAYDAPYYLICKSAGNDRGEGPIGPKNYWYDATTEDWVSIPATQIPPADGGTTGYDCIGLKGVAKNILTVGAVEEVTNYTNPSDVVMSNFSGWGPADDGRIKPDIVAKGVSVYSTSDDNNSAYTSMSGTSMATPNVSGTLALLQKYYQDTHDSNPMRAATLKALVIHTADEAGPNDGPDYQFGWGLLNAEKAAQLIDRDVTLNNSIDELLLTNTNPTFTRSVNVDGSEPLVATIVWTDIPGTPVAYSLDPSDPMLVNDLDLKITNNGNTYYPWKLDRDNPSAAATNNSANHVDNVEKVEIPNPPAGTYTIEVTVNGSLAKANSTLATGEQAFSLIVSGDNTPLPVELTTFTAELGSNNNVILNWETATELNNYGFEIERKSLTQNSNSWEKIGFVQGNGNSNSPKYYSFRDNNLSGGSNFSYRLKQIDIDGLYEYSDEVEIKISPSSFELDQNYPNPFNPSTSIKFSLPEASNVELRVYDLLGKEVITLINRRMEQGIHTVEFNAENLSSGFYIYMLKANDIVITRKMLLTK